MVSDRLSIKCTSKIGDAYWQSVVEETTLKRLGRMLESRSAAAALSTGEFLAEFGDALVFAVYRRAKAEIAISAFVGRIIWDFVFFPAEFALHNDHICLHLFFFLGSPRDSIYFLWLLIGM